MSGGNFYDDYKYKPKLSPARWWGEIAAILVMITAVMVHFIIFHYRRMKIKYEENSNIKIRETLENKEKEVPSLAAMTKQSMLFVLPMVAMAESSESENESERVPFLGNEDTSTTVLSENSEKSLLGESLQRDEKVGQAESICGFKSAPEYSPTKEMLNSMPLIGRRSSSDHSIESLDKTLYIDIS